MKDNLKSEDSFLHFSMHRTNMKLFIGVKSETIYAYIYIQLK